MFLGSKHLSIFGVLDGFGKEKLRDHFHRKYPGLKEEAPLTKDQQGYLTLLREHLVDLDILDHEEPADPPRDAGTQPQHPKMEEQHGLLSAA